MTLFSIDINSICVSNSTNWPWLPILISVLFQFFKSLAATFYTKGAFGLDKLNYNA